MKHSKFILLIILILILSCKVTESESIILDNKPIEFQFNESTYVILERPSGWERIFKNSKLSELTQIELFEIEEILKIAVKERNVQQSAWLKKENEKHPKNKRTESKYLLHLNEHYRQYLSVINENGEKEVWVNFFCVDIEDKWKTDIIAAFDGGNCYFQAKVNLTKKECHSLRMNSFG